MKRILLIILLLLILVPCGFLGYFYYEVSQEADERIERGAIDRVTASESPVYYADGYTPIGVFFEMTHSKHVPYKEIPKVFVKALIASEDSDFFDHMGFDIQSVVRAFIANMRAGRVVQGGSTITQQTAKNIFKREKRSYISKLKEAMQAFLLERRYTKEEILEMYINQFFVTGYGKGLWIASQYFFGKDPQNIDLVEAAFIAGSLKGPNRYNPFIKKGRIEKDEARKLAKARKDYVLGNMRKLDFITDEEHTEAVKREVPFQEGKVTYRLNVVLDYIRNQLESNYFKTILEEQGVDNIATSGISIYTSVDKDIQNAALMSLRRRLPLIDVELNGYSPCREGEPCQARVENKGKETEEGLPFLAQITSVNAGKDNSHLVVAWDNGGGVIDFDGFEAIGSAWLKAKQGVWAKFDRKHGPAFLKSLRVGDRVPVQLMRDPDDANEEGNPVPKLMLTAIPEIEGGIVALQRGMVRAMVGGFFDRYYNRAVHAKRQLGSIFKPIVYAAALKLKWNILDPLKNSSDVYQFQDTSYMPRPDHKPNSNMVSMAWAGAKSENLATVWLLYHLTDHLNLSEFRQVVNLVGLGRKEGETYQTYKARIRDQYGVLVYKDTLMDAAFEEAKRHVKTDIIFGGHEAALANVNRLHFDLEKVNPDMEAPETRENLRYDFQRLRRIDLRMRTQLKETVQRLQGQAQGGGAGTNRPLSEALNGFYRISEPEVGTRIVYTDHPEDLIPANLTPVTPAWLLEMEPGINIERDVWIDGLIPAAVLEALQKYMETHYRKTLTDDRYSLEVLSKIRDFRVLVNLLYVVYLSKKIGISTHLEPVLSFPLGPNSISVMEAALAYETLVTGNAYPLSPEGGVAMVPIITKIVDREGEIIYSFSPKPERVLSERVSALTTEILRKVMEVGTGRKARDTVRIFDIPLPTFGKTGTSNEFTNSSFVGLIPGYNQETTLFDMDQGYSIAAYVGYDDNRPMKGKHIEIYGASGALPLWVDTANAVITSPEFLKGIEVADLVFSGPVVGPVEGQGNIRSVPVSAITGLPLSPSREGAGPFSGVSVLTEGEARQGTWTLKREFDPF
jgi:penicillin-binding protein 1A